MKKVVILFMFAAVAANFNGCASAQTKEISVIETREDSVQRVIGEIAKTNVEITANKLAQMENTVLRRLRHGECPSERTISDYRKLLKDYIVFSGEPYPKQKFYENIFKDCP